MPDAAASAPGRPTFRPALPAPGVRRHTPVDSPLDARSLLTAAAQTFLSAVAARTELEALLKREYEADAVLLTDSGTLALQLAIRTAVSLSGRPVVALPGWSCYDVAAAAVAAGVQLILYDIDPATLGPDPDSLEAAFAAGAGVAVVAPLFGLPCDWEMLERLADRHGAVLVEDAAQGHGARWRGRVLGSLGHLSVLSFGRGKGWTGCGGGALLQRGLPGIEMPSVRRFGGRGVTQLATASAQWLLGRPSLYALPSALPWLQLGQTIYRPCGAPRSMSAAAAALLLATRADALLEAGRRRVRAAELAVRLGPDGIPATCAGAEPGWLRMPVRLPATAAQIATGLARLGVTRGYPTTLAALPSVRRRLLRRSHDVDGRLAGAAALVRELVVLPTHGRLTTAERQWLVERLTAARSRQS